MSEGDDQWRMDKPFRSMKAIDVLREGEAEAQAKLRSLMGMDPRFEALEKRVYKLEDMVREILQRLPRFERVVSTKDWQAHGEQLPPDRHSEG